MEFETYQTRAADTAIYPGRRTVQGLAYTTLGLAGEAGEFANKVKKILRDHAGQVTEEQRRAMAKELGGVLWYVSACCDELNLTMKDVALQNILDLAGRAARGTIQGNGDDR